MRGDGESGTDRAASAWIVGYPEALPPTPVAECYAGVPAGIDK